jgi:membrane-associated phospholipid phosphatase
LEQDVSERDGHRRASARTAAYAAVRLLPCALVLWAVLIGVAKYVLVEGGSVDNWDDGVERTLARDRTTFWNTITEWVTWCGETITVVIGAAISVIVLRLLLHRWREAWIIVLATAGQALTFVATQAVIQRKRPPVPKLDPSAPTSSFPSGHTAAALALYGGLAVVAWLVCAPRALRALLTTLAVIVPIAVALSRLYRGLHHPTDVLASLIFSVCWLSAVTAVVVRASHRSSHDGGVETPRHPVPA